VQRGLSLIELIVTLALSAILLRLALPGFQDLLASQRAAAASNAITATIALARTSAIVYRLPVLVCPNDMGQCGNRTHWPRGALVFADRNNNRQRDDEEPLYGTLPAFEAGASVEWRSFRNRSYLLFLPDGLTDWQNGHFQYCPNSNNPRHARQIIVNAQGRTRLAPDSDRDGIRENAQGQPLQCA
jgi:type IV fimbrial biogenesis protein FimT